MPWCDDCAKYWAPSTMTPAGECPRCGRLLDEPELAARPTNPGEPDDQQAVDEKTPWHFKLMVVALVVYLVYRFYDLLFA